MSKTWVISDIHGYYWHFVRLLMKLGFLDDQLTIVEEQENRLILLGDYIDRGRDPVGVLDLVSSLTSHIQAVALLGNHDYWLQRKLRGNDVEMQPERQNTWDLIQENPFYKGDLWLSSLLDSFPYYHSEGNIHYAHAFYSRSLAEKDQKKQRLFLYGPTADGTREFGLPNRVPWYEQYDGHRGTVIFGHYNPSHNGTITEYEHCVCVDCGVFASGRLGAYCVETGEKVYV